MTARRGTTVVFAAAFLAGLLGVIAALVVALADWAHGDEPVVASLLIVGSLVSLIGVGLALYATGKMRSFAPWLAVALNVGAFVLLSIFWRLF